MIIIVEPFDTFFFRGGKGSLVGTEANLIGQGTFPPSPSLWYGALRTAYFAHHPEKLPVANTAQDPTLNLAIKGIFLINLDSWERQKSLADALYLPTPFDVLKEKDKSGKREVKNIQYLKLKSSLSPEKMKKGKVITSSPFLDILVLDKEEGAEEGYVPSEAAKSTWMSLRDFSQKYYTGQTQDLNLLLQKNFLEQEEKTGIKINDITHAAQEEYIYRVNCFRFKAAEKSYLGYAFAIWAEGLELPRQGFMKVGADAKPAAFWQLETKEPPLPTINQGLFQRFKVYLQTPAILEKGYIPRYIQNPHKEFTHSGLTLRLLAAATGSYISIGGFDIKANKPKPMHRALEAGSVFYFELTEPTPENCQRAIQIFHLQCFSDLSLLPSGVGISSYQGFGRSYLIPLL